MSINNVYNAKTVMLNKSYKKKKEGFVIITMVDALDGREEINIIPPRLEFNFPQSYAK